MSFWREKRVTVVILVRGFAKMLSCQSKNTVAVSGFFDQQKGSVISNTILLTRVRYVVRVINVLSIFAKNGQSNLIVVLVLVLKSRCPCWPCNAVRWSNVKLSDGPCPNERNKDFRTWTCEKLFLTCELVFCLESLNSQQVFSVGERNERKWTVLLVKGPFIHLHITVCFECCWSTPSVQTIVFDCHVCYKLAWASSQLDLIVTAINESKAKEWWHS